METYAIDSGIELLEKYKGKFVQVYLDGEKITYAYTEGKLNQDRNLNYYVKNKKTIIAFKFQDVKYLQEMRQQLYKFNNKEKKSKIKKDRMILYISLVTNIEKEIKIYQEIAGDLFLGEK